MLARLLTSAEATTELRCLTELHCCLLALLPLGRYSHLRRHQTHSGPGLCIEVCLTWHPDQKTRQQPSAGSGQDNVDDRWPCHISTILIPHAVCTTVPSLGPLPPHTCLAWRAALSHHSTGNTPPPQACLSLGVQRPQPRQHPRVLGEVGVQAFKPLCGCLGLPQEIQHSADLQAGSYP